MALPYWLLSQGFNGLVHAAMNMHYKIKGKLFCLVPPTCKKKTMFCGSLWILKAVYAILKNILIAY